MSRTHHLRPTPRRWRVVVVVSRHRQEVRHTVNVRATSEAAARLKAVRHLGGTMFAPGYAVESSEECTSDS